SILYPALAPGGFYCCESFWDAHPRGIDPESVPIPPMQELLERMTRALTLGQQHQQAPMIDTLTRQTAEILAMPRAVVLTKREASR
ncbi:MAG: hypothetical protein ACR2J8_04565, partial [Thermomicrobiales bacterium]